MDEAANLNILQETSVFLRKSTGLRPLLLYSRFYSLFTLFQPPLFAMNTRRRSISIWPRFFVGFNLELQFHWFGPETTSGHRGKQKPRHRRHLSRFGLPFELKDVYNFSDPDAAKPSCADRSSRKPRGERRPVERAFEFRDLHLGI